MKNPERLHEIDTFSHFSARQLVQLVDCLRSRAYSGTERIYSEGEVDRAFFLLQEGVVRVRRMTPFGPFDLEKPRPGDLFAETSFIDDGERLGDAEALESSVVVAFDSDCLRSSCDRDPRFDLAVHWALWKSLSSKLRLANDRLIRFFSLDADASCGHPTPEAKSEREGTFEMANKIGLFREQKLSEMEVNFLASLSREERFDPGQTIFREGSSGDKMYVVAEGSVVISKTIPGIGEEALAFLEHGEYFGEMALIDDRPRSADAHAHPDTGATVLTLPREVVGGLLDIEKVSSIRLLKALDRFASKRLREVNEKLVGWYMIAGGDLDSSLD